MRTCNGIALMFGPLLLALAAPAVAQQAEATIYRDRNFNGPAVAVAQPQPNLALRFRVQSIRVASGTWELCPQPNFRGNCLSVSQSSNNLARDYGWGGTLQSMRPMQDDGWGGGSGGNGGGTSETLRGMASQYWPAPRVNSNGTRGQRVQACPRGSGTASCAQENANQFCARQGWTRSAYQRMETERGRIYLADVLCVRA